MTSTTGSQPTEPLPTTSADSGAAEQSAPSPVEPATRAVPSVPPTDRVTLPGRVWRELAYFLVTLVLSSVVFAYLIAIVSVSAGLLVTVVGLIVPAAMVVGARGFGGAFRSLGRSMLGIDVPAPPAPREVHGFWRRLVGWWSDPAGWRALLFGLVAWPLSMLASIVSTTFLAVGLGGITHWVWSRFLPEQQAPDGTMHRGASFGDSYFIDTAPRQWLMVGVGVLVLVAGWYLTRGFAAMFRGLSRGLLGPTENSLRVAHLERTRSAAVQDADARLRRIERDLHDGTQARLVAVAMQIGDVKDRLSEGPDPESAALLGAAHAGLKETLTELREIARGIHPPALDDGLAVALTTLAARCPLTVAVRTELRREPDPEIQAIAYYAVAELLSNAVKHAAADRAAVDVSGGRRRLVVQVTDNGRGGAALGLPGASGGSGLAGLGDRAAAVDGTLEIDSPAGGPTVITVNLPMSAR
ncbi:sensor domain-containing protein [Cellulomonas sp. NPDC089187]|uniref:sensor histidine kinase n=1 Tax=Cellulomonas sp. NPDC089187 TaxID=3154970 RepID=UPI003433AF57